MNRMKRIKLALLSLALTLSGVGVLGLASASAQSLSLPPVGFAADCSSTACQDACNSLTQLDSSHDCSAGSSSLTGIIKAVINILSYILGLASVIMVLVGGFKYVTSGGDSGRVGSAKSTLIYALVGLAIAALAQVLVHIVFTEATKAANAKPAYLPSITRTVDAA